MNKELIKKGFMFCFDNILKVPEIDLSAILLNNIETTAN